MDDHGSPLAVTERVLAQRGLPRVCPYARLRADGTPWTVSGRLFQAKMWREYAQAWGGRPIDRGFVGWPHGHRVILDRAWVEGILRVSRAECIRRAKANVYLAHRLNRSNRKRLP